MYVQWLLHQSRVTYVIARSYRQWYASEHAPMRTMQILWISIYFSCLQRTIITMMIHPVEYLSTNFMIVQISTFASVMKLGKFTVCKKNALLRTPHTHRVEKNTYCSNFSIAPPSKLLANRVRSNFNPIATPSCISRTRCGSDQKGRLPSSFNGVNRFLPSKQSLQFSYAT